MTARLDGELLADTTRALLVDEQDHGLVFYFPPGDVRLDRFTPDERTSVCPYKGTATYWNAVVDGVVLPDVAWSYEDALPESLPLQHLVSFDDQRVRVLHDLPPAD